MTNPLRLSPELRRRFRNRFTLPVLAAALSLAPATAAAREVNFYWDLLSPELLGQLPVGNRAHTYDLSVRSGDDWRFIGNTNVVAGTYLGGGFGMRLLAGFPSGFLLGGEALVTGGRLRDAELPFGSLSTAMHYDVSTLLGYQVSNRVVQAHLAAVLGFDGMRFEVSGPTAAAAVPTRPMDAGPAGYRLSRFDLRAGGQLGVHVAVADLVALWADGTVDYDGQYRIRAGLAIGATREARF